MSRVGSFACGWQNSTSKTRSIAPWRSWTVCARRFAANFSRQSPPGRASRIGVVLPRRSTRAYEAGALMASRCQVPTHIIAATSVAASMPLPMRRMETPGGKAESLVDSWMELTAATLGIDWSALHLFCGLIAASAAWKLLWQWMKERPLPACLSPKGTWLALGAAESPFFFLPTSFLTLVTWA